MTGLATCSAAEGERLCSGWTYPLDRVELLALVWECSGVLINRARPAGTALALALSLAGNSAAAPGVQASPVEGLWLTDDHKGEVRISPCGAQLCGYIAKVLDEGPGVPAPTSTVPTRV
jgi:uncharacterized protein (DUF2147 family)